MRGTQYSTPPVCIGCKKQAGQIRELVDTASIEDMDAATYVRTYEGTYDMFAPNKFYCDACYINAGMPVHNGRRRF